MPLLTFSDIEETSREAAKTQFTSPSVQVVILNDKTKRKAERVTVSRDDPFVVLGHTQEVIKPGIFKDSAHASIGGLTVEAMVNKFKSQVPDKKERGKVENIYLVACEAGWNDTPDNPCYARRLAEALHKAGFTNINVHAIASPANSENYDGMRVSLVHQAGIGALRPGGEQFGHASAFLCTKKYSALEAELEQMKKDQVALTKNQPAGMTDMQWRADKIRGNARISNKERELKEEGNAHRIMSADNLLKEMGRPENTYRYNAVTPQKSLQAELAAARPVARTAASAASSSAVVVDKRSAVIDELVELQADFDSKLSKKVDSLMGKMEGTNDWQEEIFSEIDRYHRSSSTTKNRDSSDYYGLLVHLVGQHDLKRGGELGKTADAVEKDLKQKGFAADAVIVNPGKKKNSTHVTVLQGDEKFEFKLKKGKDIGESVNAFLKKQKHELPASVVSEKSSKGKEQMSATAASSSEPAKPRRTEKISSRSTLVEGSSQASTSAPNPLQGSLEQALTMSLSSAVNKAAITSPPREAEGKIHLGIESPGGKSIVAALDKDKYGKQVEQMVTIIEQLRKQKMPYESLSIKAVNGGYQVALDHKPAMILDSKDLAGSLAKFAPAPPPAPPVVEPVKPATTVVNQTPPPRGNVKPVVETHTSPTPPTTPDRSWSGGSVQNRGWSSGDDSSHSYSSDSDNDEPPMDAPSSASERPLLKAPSSQFKHHYAYGGETTTTRGSHFWNKASVKAGDELNFLAKEDRSLTGDELKRAILDTFADKLNTCARDNPDGLAKLKDDIRESKEYEILNTSQGFTTSILKLFKNTDSINALNDMLEEAGTVKNKGPGH